MSKGYEKDSNGKYKLVDKETQKSEEATPEAKAWVNEVMVGPEIKAIKERLRLIEAKLFGNTK